MTLPNHRLLWKPKCALILSIILASSAAMAHHSFPATYKINETMEIEGVMVQFLFRNPHSFVHVMVTDENQVATRWAIEWGGATNLTETNVNRQTLKPGDKVVVVGNPGRNPDDHRLRLNHILRPADGFEWGGDFD